MSIRFEFFVAFVATTFLAYASARAVNISNTWMLPEEGFPVFYRYFRDRISWYEADAVCQFHHANLVTVESTSQYDAVRVFLKELDINTNVWIGLSRSSNKDHFAWSNFQPLTNEGYWQETIPETAGSICAAADPAAGFRWHGLSCGGPDVASFICELPVPEWALGPRGCLITELPSLSAFYVPEQSAIELVSDCGLDGTKQIACKGDSDREEMMKRLSCGELEVSVDDKSTKPSVRMNSSPTTSSSTTSYANTYTTVSTEAIPTKHWTSNTVEVDDYYPTRHRRETDNTLSSFITISTLKISDESNSTTSHVPLKGDTVDEERSKETFFDVETKAKPTPSFQEDVNGEYSGEINQGQLFSILENGTLFDIVELNETSSEENDSFKEFLMTTEKQGEKLTTDLLDKETPSEITITTVLYQKEPPLEDETAVTNKDIKKTNKDIESQTYPTNKTYDVEENNNTDANNTLDKKVEYAVYQASKTTLYDDLVSKAKTDKKTIGEVELFPIATNPNTKLNRTYRKQLPSPTKYPKKYVQNANSSQFEKHFEEKEKLINIKSSTPSTTKEVNEHIILDGNKEHKVVEIKLHSSKKENITKLVITTKRLRKEQKKTDFSLNSTKIPVNISNLMARNVTVLSSKFVNNKKTDNKQIDNIKTEKEVISNFNSTDAIDEGNFTKVDFTTERVSLELDSDEAKIRKGLQNSMDENELENNNEPTLQSLQSEPEFFQKNMLRNRKASKPQRKSYYPFFIGRVIG